VTRHYVIPEIFFKSIAEKEKLYSRLWFYWLSNHIDDIFNDDFVEIQQRKYPKVNEIKAVYDFGIQFLQQDFTIIQKKKKVVQKSVIKKENKAIAEKVIDYLNEQAQTKFENKGKNLELISARIEEGYGLNDFKSVIDKKVMDWKGTDWATYLRPITLFNKTKFENYLNGAEKGITNNFSKFAESIKKAQQFIAIRKDE
jgi:uncharacterized phage protein (TIGR02220 family)